MAKKQSEKKTTVKKAPAPKARATTSGVRAEAKKPTESKSQAAPTASAPEATATPGNVATAVPAAPPAPDPRLPAPGTLLQKRDRHGAVRCECTVEEGGIRYAGKVYRSLSAAAMAAVKDLGLNNKTQNLWGEPAYGELAA